MKPVFKELKKIGSIEISDTSKLKFTIISINKDKCVNIRKFIETEDYTGYTKQGVIVRQENLGRFHKLLHKAIKEVE